MYGHWEPSLGSLKSESISILFNALEQTFLGISRLPGSAVTVLSVLYGVFLPILLTNKSGPSDTPQMPGMDVLYV